MDSKYHQLWLAATQLVNAIREAEADPAYELNHGFHHKKIEALMKKVERLTDERKTTP